MYEWDLETYQAPTPPPLEPIPISALAQYAYCPRRAGLILLEGQWADNEFTLRGARAHENADLPAGLLREGVRVERALPIWSERLGLVGRADVVEFVQGVPYPVEYKISRQWPQKLARQAAEVQLCAQGLCLEEMFGQPVPEGAIFSKTSQRRRVVPLSPELRAQTLATLEALRKLLAQEALPKPAADERCRYCSLQSICMPHLPQALAQWRPAPL
ncbi:CRISPR-associated protein Cas4 [Meiothermus rufus]|uniref:CRISPR-associated protein Cas4 n=1 Tax=Meiothermus rufus TaxID=604332 RepID=UPI00041956AF|nr:CRISPR-associated protein Cas4 [Meiothermus rufus]